MIGVDSMKCEWCGKEIQDGERFCSSCKSTMNSSKNNPNPMKVIEDQMPKSKSVASIMLKIVGIIGIILGFLFLFFDIEGVIKIAVLISTVISGLILFGFGELITILLAIKDKLNLLYYLIKLK